MGSVANTKDEMIRHVGFLEDVPTKIMTGLFNFFVYK